MALAIDSSVLLDVLIAGAADNNSSTNALVTAAERESLIVCEVVVAEILPSLGDESLNDFLIDWGIRFVPSSLATARLAGEHFHNYLERGGKRGRVVPDFLIAAHAQLFAGRLLTRDDGYARDYFQSLVIVKPADLS